MYVFHSLKELYSLSKSTIKSSGFAHDSKASKYKKGFIVDQGCLLDFIISGFTSVSIV